MDDDRARQLDRTQLHMHELHAGRPPLPAGDRLRDEPLGIRFAVERLSAVMHELPPLFYEHWLEVALDKDRIALDLDF
jgi:hypothetical protein